MREHRTRNLEIPDVQLHICGLVRSLSSGGAKAPTRWDHPGITELDHRFFFFLFPKIAFQLSL
jgi:hypothetical protein